MMLLYIWKIWALKNPMYNINAKERKCIKCNLTERKY